MTDWPTWEYGMMELGDIYKIVYFGAIKKIVHDERYMVYLCDIHPDHEHEVENLDDLIDWRQIVLYF